MPWSHIPSPKICVVYTISCSNCIVMCDVESPLVLGVGYSLTLWMTNTDHCVWISYWLKNKNVRSRLVKFMSVIQQLGEFLHMIWALRLSLLSHFFCPLHTWSFCITIAFLDMFLAARTPDQWSWTSRRCSNPYNEVQPWSIQLGGKHTVSLVCLAHVECFCGLCIIVIVIVFL